MKYVYVLTSKESDTYYEQCLMSVFSLRHYMPKAEIVILVDNKTNATLTAENKRTELGNFASQIISVDFEDSIPSRERSRAIKTNIPDYVKGDFLYIDSDTVVCESLEGIENETKSCIAGVPDGHVMLNEHKLKNYFVKRDKKLGFFGTKNNGFALNGGVLLFKDCDLSRKFFKLWNELWKFSCYKKKEYHDQSALAESLFRCGIKEPFLRGEWNCQLNQGGLAYLEHAKIIHYFSSEFTSSDYVSYYKLADNKLLLRIKENGAIPDDIKKMILNPKFLFNKVMLVYNKKIIDIIHRPLISFYADLNSKHPHLFNAAEKIIVTPSDFFSRVKNKFLKIFKLK